MKLIVVKDYEEMSCRAARIIAAQVLKKSDSVLGLATGSTPIGTYRCLIEFYRKKLLDFRTIKTVNLDEYHGLSQTHPQSFRFFMEENFFQHVNLRTSNIHMPEGKAVDPEQETVRYGKLIDSLGGIDLQMLGIGLNGHIGFNEPDDTFSRTVTCVELTQSTIEAYSRFFENTDDVPRRAYTMGIATIMQAKELLLLASGAEKREIIQQAVYGPITTRVPASVLQLHPNVTVITDESAGALL